MRVYDYKCIQGHVTEKFLKEETKEITCSECGALAGRVLSAPRFTLDGISGDYPTAYDAWENKRREKLKEERKKNPKQ